MPRAHPSDPCPPKFDRRTGKAVEQVRIPTARGSRCVKAGGKASKEAGLCPTGKVLIKATYRVPGTNRMVPGSRCVKATGKYEALKTCPPGQVLVEMPRSGVTPALHGRPPIPWRKDVRLCVREQTAHAKGYRIVG